MAQDDYTAQERQLLKDKRDLKSLSRETELAHEDQIKSLKLVCIPQQIQTSPIKTNLFTGSRGRN